MRSFPLQFCKSGGKSKMLWRNGKGWPKERPNIFQRWRMGAFWRRANTCVWHPNLVAAHLFDVKVKKFSKIFFQPKHLKIN